MAVHPEFGRPFAATEGLQGKIKFMTVPFAKFQVGLPASKPQGCGFAGLPDPHVRPAGTLSHPMGEGHSAARGKNKS